MDFETKKLLGLAEEKVKPQQKVKVNRLGLTLTLEAIRPDDMERIREEHTRVVGKGRNAKTEFDEDEFNRHVIAAMCVSPNFNEEQVLATFKASSGAKVVQELFYTGEQLQIMVECQKLIGFHDDAISVVDDVKNESETAKGS